MENTKAKWIFIALFAFFIALRLPGINVPYHQDEWKNVNASRSAEAAGSFFAHPPMQQIFFVSAYKVFGEDNMRFPFILFGAGAAVLLYLIISNRGGKKAALWSTTLFIFCFYNVLGSLMTDVDGGILPFFFLLAVFAYDKFNASLGVTKWRWFSLLVVALLLGFLVKLSFVLAVGAIALDYAWNNRRNITVKKASVYLGLLSVFGIGYVFILYVIQGVYSAFSISFMLKHANQFAEDAGRSYIQIVVQAVKAVYYVSPLTLLVLWLDKEIINKTRVFWTYLLSGFFFYFVLFDFSRGALDKYLMFIIVPLCAMSGMVLSKVFEGQTFGGLVKKYKFVAALSLLICLGIISSIFVHHTAVPLYPKTEWFSRVLHGHWNVLTPLNGGSGPLGFYVSFLFIALAYISGFIAVVVGVLKRNWRVGSAIFLAAIVLSYNAVFIEEYFFGVINGSAANVLSASMDFIKSRPDIKEVITYNDIGAQKLANMNIYAGRFYAAPQFEEGHKVKFTAYNGDYMVVGIPPLYQGFYSDFFSKCDTLFDTQSGNINGKVYSCKHQNQ